MQLVVRPFSEMPPSSRKPTIFSELARVVSHQAFAGDQHVLRLHAPRAAAAQPGQFVHLRCADDLPLRRPYSVLTADADAATLDVLYKVTGDGGRRLAALRAGDVLSLLGPIGNTFAPHPERPRLLVVGGGVGVPPILFLAERVRDDARYQPFACLGSELPFPFRVTRSSLPFAGVPAATNAATASLERRAVASRLASGRAGERGFEGCHRGTVVDLAHRWLAAAPPHDVAKTALFACGPRPMLAAVARLAARYALPCQVALEEYMACGVGGCAGCAVAVRENGRSVMRRVCVDGPVFDARAIFV